MLTAASLLSLLPTTTGQTDSVNSEAQAESFAACSAPMRVPSTWVIILFSSEIHTNEIQEKVVLEYGHVLCNTKMFGWAGASNL